MMGTQGERLAVFGYTGLGRGAIAHGGGHCLRVGTVRKPPFRLVPSCDQRNDTRTSIIAKLLRRSSDHISSLSILHEARRKILPRLGVVRTLPLVFQESSRRYQGLGLPSVRTEELVNQLRLFLMHYQTPSLLGQMFACQEQDIVVELGVGTHFLQLDYWQYGFLATDCWLKSMWSKFPAGRVQVHCRDAPNLPLRRQGDCYLMEVWIRSGDFSEEELTAINRCRKRKQVYSVADVATGDGQRLQPWASQSSAPRGLEASEITFGIEHPTRADWVLWAHALRSLTERSGALRRSVGPEGGGRIPSTFSKIKGKIRFLAACQFFARGVLIYCVRFHS